MMLPSASSGRMSVGILARHLVQQLLGLLDALELVEVQRLADVDARLQRRILRDAVVGGDGAVVALGGLVGVGERGQGEGEVGPQVEGELQVDGADADAALARSSASPSP